MNPTEAVDVEALVIDAASEIATKIMAMDWKPRGEWTVEEQSDRYGDIQVLIATALSTLAAERDAAIRDAEDQAREPQWQPIASRPENEFIFVSNGFFRSIAEWQPIPKRWLDYGAMNYGDPLHIKDCWFEPTHWMPLPATPNKIAQKLADATPNQPPSEARADGVKEREATASWHEAEARRWNAELWERRSWGGPTIGAEECILAEKIHKEAAARIRSALTAPDHADVASQGGERS